MNEQPRVKLVPTERQRRLAEIYNRAGMALLAMAPCERHTCARTEEDIRYCRQRLVGIERDTLAYACDTGDDELYERGMLMRAEVEATIATLEQLPSLEEESFRLAGVFFRRAAWLADPEGMWNLGWRLMLGEGMARDPELALRWWTLAANRGHAGARRKIEEHESVGRGSPVGHPLPGGAHPPDQPV